jgi:hypothetical protein
MATFAGFADLLDEEHRAAFLGSIPLLIAMVVGADEVFDELEMEAAVDALITAEQALGPEFRQSPEAQAAFDRLSANARERDPLFFASQLSRLGAVVRELPPELAAPYRAFIHDMCLHLAKASGGFFWFGSAISEEEKVTLRRIAAAIGVRFPEIDEELRAIAQAITGSATGCWFWEGLAIGACTGSAAVENETPTQAPTPSGRLQA